MGTIEPFVLPLNDGQSVRIRSADPADAEGLLAYVADILEECEFMVTEPGEFDKTVEQERQWIADHRDPSGNLCLLAEVAGTVVGIVSFEVRRHRRVSHVGGLGISVRKGWRGCGIGSALLKACLDWAQREPQIEKVGLAVFSSNEAAINLYRKFGFVEEGRRYHEMKLGPGKYVDDVLMYRWVK